MHNGYADRAKISSQEDEAKVTTFLSPELILMRMWNFVWLFALSKET